MIGKKADESNPALAKALRAGVERHLWLTHSPTARRLLEGWEETLAKFWRVVPRASLLLASVGQATGPAQEVAD